MQPPAPPQEKRREALEFSLQAGGTMQEVANQARILRAWAGGEIAGHDPLLPASN
jgi:hypothetical protein